MVSMQGEGLCSVTHVWRLAITPNLHMHDIRDVWSCGIVACSRAQALHAKHKFITASQNPAAAAHVCDQALRLMRPQDGRISKTTFKTLCPSC